MENITFAHTSVLLDECIEGLNIRPDGIYVDCTLGGGGHSSEIVKRLGEGGRLICIDRDTDAINAAKQRLHPYLDKITFVHNNFSLIKSILAELDIGKIDGILFDLGVSSYQLDTPERGFSYMNNAVLDMRMDKSSPLTAKEVVNTYSYEKLKDILYTYGEEDYAPKIAAAIVNSREEKEIQTTGELVDIIKNALPKKALLGAHHPAKRSFQAIRIEVNCELDSIKVAIKDAFDALAKDGRIAVISFHSLEDRITKQIFSSFSGNCTCPPDFPVCICGAKNSIKILTKKPILPSSEECESNPRARSAKLRIAERICE